MRNGRLKLAKPLSFSFSFASLSSALEIACPLKTTAISSSSLIVVSYVSACVRGYFLPSTINVPSAAFAGLAPSCAKSVAEPPMTAMPATKPINFLVIINVFSCSGRSIKAAFDRRHFSSITIKCQAGLHRVFRALEALPTTLQTIRRIHSTRDCSATIMRDRVKKIILLSCR